MTHPMVKRALEHMMKPRPLPDDFSHLNDLPTVAEVYPNGTPAQQMQALREENMRLRDRIAELERERDGLLEIIV